MILKKGQQRRIGGGGECSAHNTYLDKQALERLKSEKLPSPSDRVLKPTSSCTTVFSPPLPSPPHFTPPSCTPLLLSQKKTSPMFPLVFRFPVLRTLSTQDQPQAQAHGTGWFRAVQCNRTFWIEMLWIYAN